MFDDLILQRAAPAKRAPWCEGGLEHHLTEGAVMVAFAFHLLRRSPGLRHVALHPDGEHAKLFGFRQWLADRRFLHVERMGSTEYGGLYRDPDGRTILVNPKSGRGDVVADMPSGSVVAECKGGVINTRHPGQRSRLRGGLCEAIGQLFGLDDTPGRRQFAVVPNTPVTADLAARIWRRAAASGIEIALVDGRGRVVHVGEDHGTSA